MAEKTKKAKTPEDKELTLEELFTALDETIGTLEDQESSLEDSFKAYEKGMELVRKANAKIDLVEKQVRVINERGGLDEFPGGAGAED